jgi:hypothetical protein
LRRVKIHRDDADDQKHTEYYVQNRGARGARCLEGQSSPFTPYLRAAGEAAAKLKPSLEF